MMSVAYLKQEIETLKRKNKTLTLEIKKLKYMMKSLQEQINLMYVDGDDE